MVSPRLAACAAAVSTGGQVSVRDPSEIGHLAATRLFDRIDGERSPARLLVVPTRLIARGSGELPPP